MTLSFFFYFFYVYDVLRLSKGMTYKAAIAGLNLGGGKAVIIGDPKSDKSEDLFFLLANQYSHVHQESYLIQTIVSMFLQNILILLYLNILNKTLLTFKNQ